MIDVMLPKLRLYEAEALQCNTVVLATVLHAEYQLKFFEDMYPGPEKADQVLDLLSIKLNKVPELRDVREEEYRQPVIPENETTNPLKNTTLSPHWLLRRLLTLN